MGQSSFLTWYLQHKKLLEIVLLSGVFAINMIASGYVAYIEDYTSGVAAWEPWLWEFSSHISVFALLPALAWFSDRYPLKLVSIKMQLLRHLLASLIFFATHLLLMVALRSMVYSLVSEQYTFDWGVANLLYEYAKDIRIYLFFIVLFEAYRFVLRRWRGEASAISEAPDVHPENRTQPWLNQVLVKMLNQEFLIKLSQVEFIKTAGNYQELFVKGRAYPFRITQSALLAQLDPDLFLKINRSEIVNLTFVVQFSKRKGSDARLTLQDGTELTVHKNYLDKVPEQLRVIEV